MQPFLIGYRIRTTGLPWRSAVGLQSAPLFQLMQLSGLGPAPTCRNPGLVLAVGGKSTLLNHWPSFFRQILALVCPREGGFAPEKEGSDGVTHDGHLAPATESQG